VEGAGIEGGSKEVEGAKGTGIEEEGKGTKRSKERGKNGKMHNVASCG